MYYQYLLNVAENIMCKSLPKEILQKYFQLKYSLKNQSIKISHFQTKQFLDNIDFNKTHIKTQKGNKSVIKKKQQTQQIRKSLILNSQQDKRQRKRSNMSRKTLKPSKKQNKVKQYTDKNILLKQKGLHYQSQHFQKQNQLQVYLINSRNILNQNDTSLNEQKTLNLDYSNQKNQQCYPSKIITSKENQKARKDNKFFTNKETQNVQRDNKWLIRTLEKVLDQNLILKKILKNKN